MSEFPQTRDLLPKAVSPNTMIGVASPLWGLFAGAAFSGVAWWWMTRWTRPQNLEALFGALTPAVDTVPEVVAEEALTGVFPQTVVGGEGAPFGIVMEALVEAQGEAEAAAEPVEELVEAAAEPTVAGEPESEPTPAAALEATPEPEPEPAPAPKPAAQAAPAPKPRPKAPAEPRSVAPKSGPAAAPKAD